MFGSNLNDTCAAGPVDHFKFLIISITLHGSKLNIYYYYLIDIYRRNNIIIIQRDKLKKKNSKPIYSADWTICLLHNRLFLQLNLSYFKDLEKKSRI